MTERLSDGEMRDRPQLAAQRAEYIRRVGRNPPYKSTQVPPMNVAEVVNDEPWARDSGWSRGAVDLCCFP